MNESDRMDMADVPENTIITYKPGKHTNAGGTQMDSFKPFELDLIPMDDQVMSWDSMIKKPYDKNNVDAFTRCRVILMNGIENNAVLTGHAIARMTEDNEIKKQLAMIRRADSQQQQTVNWLNPANQSVAETTIGYEQVAVDLTANLARNEPDKYLKGVLDFTLLEDFDHLFRYGCLLELLEGKDPNDITQGKTMIKEGRPTKYHHRHPIQEMRKHFDASSASIKSWMNYFTIVSAEQQTELFYKSHGFMYSDDLARKLYSEIADVEEEHVSHYELVGDPKPSALQMMTLLQLNEAYNYFSCAQTEPDDRIRKIWEQFCAEEITHVMMCNDMLKKFEHKDMMDMMKTDVIEPLIVFEENKDYVQHILDTQVQLQPLNMEHVPHDQLPDDWESFTYRMKLNGDMIPSDIVVEKARQENKLPKAA